MTERDWSDDDALLVAYLDGQLPATDAKRLEERLSHEPELAVRLEAMDIDVAGLRNGLDGILGEAPDAAPQPQAASNFPRYAAAACLALALLFGGWMLGRQAPTEDWRDFAAAYHLLYRSETLATERVGDGGIETVSAALGRDLSPLTRISGLDFRRAQVLGWKDQPLVQLAYLDSQGRPFAICVIKAEADGSSLESTERHGLPTASFDDGGFQIMVIGAAGVADVSAITREVSELL